ncbi:hypothetical protein [Actinospongicola halichondriae]|uniref:hypothetical protein n=1 Tax=Actinospongicola halichondriae TaxID=3236844 RepID=UPI003D5A3285
MKNENRQRPWEATSAAPGDIHLGIRVLWAVIAGYAAVVLPIALLSAALPTVLTDEMHILGVGGTIVAVLVTLRRHRADDRRSVPAKDRPHDGWIA